MVVLITEDNFDITEYSADPMSIIDDLTIEVGGNKIAISVDARLIRADDILAEAGLEDSFYVASLRQSIALAVIADSREDFANVSDDISPETVETLKTFKSVVDNKAEALAGLALNQDEEKKVRRAYSMVGTAGAARGASRTHDVISDRSMRRQIGHNNPQFVGTAAKAINNLEQATSDNVREHGHIKVFDALERELGNLFNAVRTKSEKDIARSIRDIAYTEMIELVNDNGPAESKEMFQWAMENDVIPRSGQKLLFTPPKAYLVKTGQAGIIDRIGSLLGR